MHHLFRSWSTIVLLLFLFRSAQAQVAPYVATGFGSPDDGYYFLTTQPFEGSPYPNQILILDGSADIVYRKQVQTASHFRVWPDGRMTYSTGTIHILMDPTFTITDSVKCVNGVQTDTHEIQLLANGHFLLLGGEYITMDLSGYHVFNHNNTPGSPNALVRSSIIQEVDAANNLVWEWHAIDHFDFLETDTSRLTNPALVDWIHSNALDLDTDGNILLSSRNFNQIAKIDRSTDSIIWRLGGTHSDFTFTNDPGFFLQHDGRRIANGNITLYDDSRPDAHPARGVEYSLDEVNQTATCVWSGHFDSSSVGGAWGSMQRLADGNSVVSWGSITPGYATFTVFNPDSSRAGELAFVDTIASYRTLFFPELPFTIDRPVITCTVMDSVTFQLTASGGGASYLWSTGAVGPTIIASAGDSVYVETPVGSGGFLRSEPYVPATQCLTTGIGPDIATAARIFPNPAGSVLHVEWQKADPPGRVEIIDAHGKILLSTTTTKRNFDLALAGFEPGPYFLRLDGSTFPFVKN